VRGFYAKQPGTPAAGYGGSEKMNRKAALEEGAVESPETCEPRGPVRRAAAAKAARSVRLPRGCVCPVSQRQIRQRGWGTAEELQPTCWRGSSASKAPYPAGGRGLGWWAAKPPMRRRSCRWAKANPSFLPASPGWPFFLFQNQIDQ
jgi:hypothetical protein